MNPEELSKLKQGDVVRHEPSGADYIVLNNVGGVPTVIRSIQLHTGPDWSRAAPSSLVDTITALENLGWTYHTGTGRWISPDGFFRTESLRLAWENRDYYNKTPAPVVEARAVLVSAGWKKVWKSPSGALVEGTLAAYKEATREI